MSSPRDSKSSSSASKKRAGRKRLPPLAPGPALQFVVASHPDDFKADRTMRNVRSHVMYKHRGEVGGPSDSPRERSMSTERRRVSSQGITRTPSPMTTTSEGLPEDNVSLAPSARRHSTIWDSELYRLMAQSYSTDPIRTLAARIISATTAEPARSAPPTLDQASEFPFPSEGAFGQQESLEELKYQYFGMEEFRQEQSWMEVVCSNRMAFLSHVSAACVYQDVAEGFLEDSSLTVYAKTKLLRLINDSLQGYDPQTDDFTILSILHLLISEIGGLSEDVFNVHLDGLVRIVHKRGGLNNLGLNGGLSAFLVVLLLNFTVLRGHSEPAMLNGFAPSRRQSAAMESPLPISPLFAPHGDLSHIYGSCSDAAYETLRDMYDLTRTFVVRWDYGNNAFSPQTSSEVASYDAHMQQIWTRLLMAPSTHDNITPDWIYESIRLASLIYCRSILQGLPLSESANVIHAHGYGMDMATTTMISALHQALENTDKRGNWGNMCGVLLWICLVGGAASFPDQSVSVFEQDDSQTTAWARKWFSLHAVKTSLACGLEQARAVVESQRMMLQIQRLINVKRGIASQ